MHIVELLMSGATGGRPTLESVTTLCHVRWASSAAQLEMVHIGLGCVVPDLTERLSVEGARGRLAALATTLREGPESVGQQLACVCRSLRWSRVSPAMKNIRFEEGGGGGWGLLTHRKCDCTWPYRVRVVFAKGGRCMPHPELSASLTNVTFGVTGGGECPWPRSPSWSWPSGCSESLCGVCDLLGRPSVDAV